MTSKRYIYAFEEGDGKNKMLLGGKGANLCEMTQIGLNVPPGFVEDNPEFFARMARLIEKGHDAFLEDACFAPREPEESEKPKPGTLMLIGEENPPSLQQRWLNLGRIARSLEAMSHKQLRRQPWTQDEDIFLRSYGAQLVVASAQAMRSRSAPTLKVTRSAIRAPISCQSVIAPS